MKDISTENRLHLPLAILIYLLGFYAPWERYRSASTPEPLWSAASMAVARLGMSFGSAVLLITLIALVFAIIGTALRLFTTAKSLAYTEGRLIPRGLFRYLRHPDYLGTWIFQLSLTLLLPPTGALFAASCHGVLLFLLIRREEARLLKTYGEEYRSYQAKTPCLYPALRAVYPQTEMRANWLLALLSESYFLTYLGCFSVLAWNYNAFPLERSAIICFGIWIVLKALPVSREQAN